MSEAVMVEVIQKLESFLVETPSLDIYYQGVSNGIINELRMMLDFLRDKTPGERSNLKYLLADFIEMAQDSTNIIVECGDLADILLDSCALDWLRRTKKRMIAFGAGGGRETRPQSVDDEEGAVVGLEEDVRQLIGRAILNESSDHLVSRIKGMLGAGKTTLARQVYSHPAVVARFERRAWVSLSIGTSVKEVLVELIRQMVEETEGGSSLLVEMDNESLGRMLRQRLQGMSYFVVLDNPPREIHLKSILDGLPNNGHGSRVLITNQYEITSLSESRPDVYYTHEMKPLDPDESWQLFLKTIFRDDKFTSDENKFSKDSERKGREMLRKCQGLPVAIIDVGREKAKQRLTGIAWEELFDSIDLGESLKTLEPMYHKLDEDLKACFMHMSFFKENAIMRQEKLEQIWAARGINNMGRVGRPSYHLVNESIIEVVRDFRRMFEVKRCRINPLLHMLSIKKAEEKMGFEIEKRCGNNRPSQNPRHRVVQCSRETFHHTNNQDRHLVSLIFHGCGGYLGPSYWESFEHLNILDIEDFGVKTLSGTIGTLIELRYLGLRNNYIQEIPLSFGGLKRLETLDIALNFLVEVSDIIGEMGSLRNLHMSDAIFKMPLKIDALQNLEILTYVSICDVVVSSLENMTRLRKLGIEEVDENSDVSKLFASLKLVILKRLTLRGFRFRSMPCLDLVNTCAGHFKGPSELKLDGRLARLPSARNFPEYITYLVLVNTCLDEDPMLVLQDLALLNVLKLRNAYTGQQMVIEHGFGSLHVLRINELWNLRNIQVGNHAMYGLKQLEIKNCPHLETLPEQIGSMKYLRKFKMVTTKHIATKIKNCGLISKIFEVDISP